MLRAIPSKVATLSLASIRTHLCHSLALSVSSSAHVCRVWMEIYGALLGEGAQGMYSVPSPICLPLAATDDV